MSLTDRIRRKRTTNRKSKSSLLKGIALFLITILVLSNPLSIQSIAQAQEAVSENQDKEIIENAIKHHLNATGGTVAYCTNPLGQETYSAKIETDSTASQPENEVHTPSQQVSNAEVESISQIEERKRGQDYTHLLQVQANASQLPLELHFHPDSGLSSEDIKQVEKLTPADVTLTEDKLIVNDPTALIMIQAETAGKLYFTTESNVRILPTRKCGRLGSVLATTYQKQVDQYIKERINPLETQAELDRNLQSAKAVTQSPSCVVNRNPDDLVKDGSVVCFRSDSEDQFRLLTEAKKKGISSSIKPDSEALENTFYKIKSETNSIQHLFERTWAQFTDPGQPQALDRARFMSSNRIGTWFFSWKLRTGDRGEWTQAFPFRKGKTTSIPGGLAALYAYQSYLEDYSGLARAYKRVLGGWKPGEETTNRLANIILEELAMSKATYVEQPTTYWTPQDTESAKLLGLSKGKRLSTPSNLDDIHTLRKIRRDLSIDNAEFESQGGQRVIKIEVSEKAKPETAYLELESQEDDSWVSVDDKIEREFNLGRNDESLTLRKTDTVKTVSGHEIEADYFRQMVNNEDLFSMIKKGPDRRYKGLTIKGMMSENKLPLQLRLRQGEVSKSAVFLPFEIEGGDKSGATLTIEKDVPLKHIRDIGLEQGSKKVEIRVAGVAMNQDLSLQDLQYTLWHESFHVMQMFHDNYPEGKLSNAKIARTEGPVTALAAAWAGEQDRGVSKVLREKYPEPGPAGKLVNRHSFVPPSNLDHWGPNKEATFRVVSKLPMLGKWNKPVSVYAEHPGYKLSARLDTLGKIKAARLAVLDPHVPDDIQNQQLASTLGDMEYLPEQGDTKAKSRLTEIIMGKRPSDLELAADQARSKSETEIANELIKGLGSALHPHKNEYICNYGPDKRGEIMTTSAGGMTNHLLAKHKYKIAERKIDHLKRKIYYLKQEKEAASSQSKEQSLQSGIDQLQSEIDQLKQKLASGQELTKDDIKYDGWLQEARTPVKELPVGPLGSLIYQFVQDRDALAKMEQAKLIMERSNPKQGVGAQWWRWPGVVARRWARRLLSEERYKRLFAPRPSRWWLDLTPDQKETVAKWVADGQAPADTGIPEVKELDTSMTEWAAAFKLKRDYEQEGTTEYDLANKAYQQALYMLVLSEKTESPEAGNIGDTISELGNIIRGKEPAPLTPSAVNNKLAYYQNFFYSSIPGIGSSLTSFGPVSPETVPQAGGTGSRINLPSTVAQPLRNTLNKMKRQNKAISAIRNHVDISRLWNVLLKKWSRARRVFREQSVEKKASLVQFLVNQGWNLKSAVRGTLGGEATIKVSLRNKGMNLEWKLIDILIERGLNKRQQGELKQILDLYNLQSRRISQAKQLGISTEGMIRPKEFGLRDTTLLLGKMIQKSAVASYKRYRNQGFLKSLAAKFSYTSVASMGIIIGLFSLGPNFQRAGQRYGNSFFTHLGNTIEYTGKAAKYVFLTTIGIRALTVLYGAYVEAGTVGLALAFNLGGILSALSAASLSTLIFVSVVGAIAAAVATVIWCQFFPNSPVPICRLLQGGERQLEFFKDKIEAGESADYALSQIPHLQDYPPGAQVPMQFIETTKSITKHGAQWVPAANGSCQIHRFAPAPFTTLCQGQVNLSHLEAGTYEFKAKYNYTSLPNWYKNATRAVKDYQQKGKAYSTFKRGQQGGLIHFQDKYVCIQRQEGVGEDWKPVCYKTKLDFKRTTYRITPIGVSGRAHLSFSKTNKEQTKVGCHLTYMMAGEEKTYSCPQNQEKFEETMSTEERVKTVMTKKDRITIVKGLTGVLSVTTNEDKTPHYKSDPFVVRKSNTLTRDDFEVNSTPTPSNSGAK